MICGEYFFWDVMHIHELSDEYECNVWWIFTVTYPINSEVTCLINIHDTLMNMTCLINLHNMSEDYSCNMSDEYSGYISDEYSLWSWCMINIEVGCLMNIHCDIDVWWILRLEYSGAMMNMG